MATINDIKKDAETRMKKSVESLKVDLQKLRTGRASAALLEHLKVDYYGSPTPVSQVAAVAVTDARTITVTPWEKNMVGPVEKAILGSDLGLTPNTAGQVIRIVFPPLTEQRRKELVKVVHHEGENAKVAIRNVRRDANQHIKDLLKNKQITEDEEKKSEEDVQKLTDKYVKEVDGVVKHKEDELMQL
jgi:ribosome recycling factor